MNYIEEQAIHDMDSLMGIKTAANWGRLWNATGGKFLNWLGNKVTGVAQKGVNKFIPNTAQMGGRLSPGIGGRVAQGVGSNNFYNMANRATGWMGQHPQAVGAMTLGGAYGGYQAMRNRMQPISLQSPMPIQRPMAPQMGIPQYPNYY